ncbi:MAG TPA: CarD family transcriptional regulator [Anaerolineae bacterium]|nr:CarD family transcriptional regulator [Anaerolineae bacterium]
MDFSTGDEVVHPNYGVGHIVRMEERQLAEAKTRLYYVLAFGKATVWIPVDNGAASALRLVTAAGDLDHYRTLLKSCPVELDRDYKKRRLDINEQLTQGSFQVTCEIVRDLTALGWHRTLTGIDASLLSKVRTNLCEEWAASTGRPLPEAIQEVTTLLQAGEEIYKVLAPQHP